MVSKEIKSQAKKLYIKGHDVPEILDMLSGLKVSTLYTWIRDEKWKEHREKLILNQQSAGDIMLGHLEKLLQQIQRISDKVIDVEDEDSAEKLATHFAKISDAISKVTKSLRTISKDQDKLSQILFSFGEFKLYVSSQEKKFSESFLDDLDKLLKGFQIKMLDKFSSKNQNG